MKNFTLLTAVLLLVVTSLGCNNATRISQTTIAADSLLADINKYCNTNVTTEGYIVHICGVDNKKMKLKTASGEIIKVLWADSLKSFDRLFLKKNIKVTGLLTEQRIEKGQIDKMEHNNKLLCHIDKTPCTDTAWVNKHKLAGTADTLLNRDIRKLRSKLNESPKKYISIVSILAEKCEIITDEKN